MSTKSHSCPRYRKITKFRIGLTKHLHTYKGQIYPKSLYEIQLNYYNKEDILGKNLKNSKGDLLGETDNNTAINGVAETPIRHMSWKR